jgi:hypothetical protein
MLAALLVSDPAFMEGVVRAALVRQMATVKREIVTDPCQKPKLGPIQSRPFLFAKLGSD